MPRAITGWTFLAPKALRFVIAFLIAFSVPLAPVESSQAAPCPMHTPAGQAMCPCCDTAVLASVPCVACLAGIKAETSGIERTSDAQRIFFARLIQTGSGLTHKPPLPPPREG